VRVLPKVWPRAQLTQNPVYTFTASVVDIVEGFAPLAVGLQFECKCED